MATDTPPAPRTPWHLWLVGVLSLLWNTMGAFDFFMTQTRSAEYLKGFTQIQRDYIHSFPVWVVITWGIATWGSVLGSLSLLARRRLAVGIFLVSILGMVPTTLYNYVFSDGLKIMGGGSGALVFSAVIWLVAFLLWFYARAMRRRGVLR